MYAGYGATMILNGCPISVDKEDYCNRWSQRSYKSTAMKALFGMLPLSRGLLL